MSLEEATEDCHHREYAMRPRKKIQAKIENSIIFVCKTVLKP